MFVDSLYCPQELPTLGIWVILGPQMTNNNFPSTWVLLWRTQNNWHNALVKDPKTIGTMAAQKVMFFYQHFWEKLLFLISKQRHHIIVICWNEVFFSQEDLKICGSCKKCVMWRVRFISLIKMWSHPSSLSSSSTTLNCVLFSCPWAFFKGTPFFFRRAVFMSWVGCQLEWLFSRLDRSSGRQRNRGQIGSGRNQLQLATRLFFTLST